MNVYWDSSALVKRYLLEAGTSAVIGLLREATLSGTVIITRAEIAGVFSKSVSRGLLTEKALQEGMKDFRTDWPSYLRIRLNEILIRDADHLAIHYALRGYDAVHLSAALAWKDRITEPVRFATFDDRLWNAAAAEGFGAFPETLPSEFIKSVES